MVITTDKLDFAQNSRDNFIKIECCKNCKEKNNCEGINERYIQIYGVSEFYPIK